MFQYYIKLKIITWKSIQIHYFIFTRLNPYISNKGEILHKIHKIRLKSSTWVSMELKYKKIKK